LAFALRRHRAALIASPERGVANVCPLRMVNFEKVGVFGRSVESGGGGQYLMLDCLLE
jgi:hypothetical protein